FHQPPVVDGKAPITVVPDIDVAPHVPIRIGARNSDFAGRPFSEADVGLKATQAIHESTVDNFQNAAAVWPNAKLDAAVFQLPQRISARNSDFAVRVCSDAKLAALTYNPALANYLQFTVLALTDDQQAVGEPP